MDRMKTFGKYLLMFLAFYVFVDFIMFMSLKNIYKNIDYTILENSPQIEITESKATAVNGYIIGKLKNTTESRIECIYIKIDLYSKRDVLLGSKYVKIPYFNTNQTKEFRANYKYQGVSYCKISFTTENMDEIMEQQEKELEKKIEYWIPVVGLVTLMLI